MSQNDAALVPFIRSAFSTTVSRDDGGDGGAHVSCPRRVLL